MTSQFTLRLFYLCTCQCDHPYGLPEDSDIGKQWCYYLHSGYSYLCTCQCDIPVMIMKILILKYNEVILYSHISFSMHLSMWMKHLDYPDMRIRAEKQWCTMNHWWVIVGCQNSPHIPRLCDITLRGILHSINTILSWIFLDIASLASTYCCYKVHLILRTYILNTHMSWSFVTNTVYIRQVIF